MFLADEGNGQTLGTEPTGTTHAVEVGVSVTWHVVVDSQVDPLDVDTTTEDVGGDADSFVELLELLVTLDAKRLLAHVIQKRCNGCTLTALLG